MTVDREAKGMAVDGKKVGAGKKGEKAKAKEEFETLVGYSSGFQAHVRYAECLIGWGELGRARELCEQAQAKAKRLPAYARKLHKPELDQLKELAKRTQTV